MFRPENAPVVLCVKLSPFFPAISQPLLVLHPADAPHGFGLSAADLPTHARRALCADMAQLQVAAQPVVAAIQDFLTD